ncbi:hypothetical protein BT96DRAFT_936102 [Gymnopus androsaceus JB14]|uniref:Uncharacterized protein n=1 Tax=Gymnopus androsaceus JB14 TaxID=1447944 RepID=A0A6A4I077_9AGAR|nr:hypothetical protein BT96DRAFT_936102 [Gymnopus androsaceus JB14]
MSKLEETDADIHKYVVHRMMKGSGGLGFLDEDQCKILADNAAVCEALHGNGKAGLTVKARFERFMSLTGGDRDLIPLDKLYKSILEDIFDYRDPQAISQYKIVMSQILAAFEPLSIRSLQGIQLARFKYNDEKHDKDGLNAVIPFLGSLFTEVENLPEKILQNITPELSYACLFWDSHMLHSHSNELLPLVEKFINESLLFWVEVLGILGRVNGITDVSANVLKWSKSNISCE